MKVRLLMAATAAVAAINAAPASAAPALKTGLAGPEFSSADPSVRSAWSARADQANASVIRIDVLWSSLAPTRPANASSPLDPAYRFTALDGAVRSVRARGMAPMLTVYDAPDWALGGGCKSDPGSCKPSPTAFGRLGAALAKRYSGSVLGLPRVKYFEAWNEPNLSLFLAPQWRKKKPVGALRYRQMLNAFATGVHSAHGSNKVIGGGTAPFGDSRGPRARPVAFWRNVFCLNKRLRKKCGAKVKLDILAHHAINPGGGPTRHAHHRDDAAVPDLNRVARVLRAAEKRGNVPGGRHPLWMTEMWWETDPPDGKHGVGFRKQAGRIVRTMYEVWRDGARVAVNYQIRDHAFAAGTPSASIQAGLYLRSGKAKPAVRAFRFPFLAKRKGKRNTLAWGKAPRAGKLRIQRRAGKRWKTVASRRIGRGKVFQMKVRGKAKGAWRATVGRSESLTS